MGKTISQTIKYGKAKDENDVIIPIVKSLYRFNDYSLRFVSTKKVQLSANTMTDSSPYIFSVYLQRR